MPNLFIERQTDQIGLSIYYHSPKGKLRQVHVTSDAGNLEAAISESRQAVIDSISFTDEHRPKMAVLALVLGGKA